MRDAIPWAVLALIAVAGFVLFRADAVPAVILPTASPMIIADGTFPPVLLEAAGAMATWYAPTVEPTRKPPTMVPATPVPMEQCGPWVQAGTLCEMPPVPDTPTPVPPPCPTDPRMICIWKGT